MEGMECIKCKKIAKTAKPKFQGYEIEGWKCECGEKYYDPEQAQRILTMNKMKDETIEVLRLLSKILDLKEARPVKLRVVDLKKIEVSSE